MAGQLLCYEGGIELAGKRFSGRVQHTRDTSANWTQADPVLLSGEHIFVETNTGAIRTKTGDGTKRYTQLPFDDEPIYNAIGLKGDASKQISFVLLASGWSGDQQTLYSDEIKSASQNGVAALSSSINDDALNAAMQAGLLIKSQDMGSLTVSYVGTKPEIDIPIILTLIG